MTHQQLLSQQYLNKTLPHAILINGATGSGKLTLAQWLVNILLCQTLHKNVEHHLNSGNAFSGELEACGNCKTCLLVSKLSYPDHLALELTGASIGIDDVRRANAFLEKTAHIGKFKTVLIPNAQTMTVAAANALLKTLEEPTANSIIILLSHDVELLLPTIVSRCRVLTMKGQVGAALISQFQQQANETSELDGFVNLSHLPELQEATVNNAYQVFKQSCLNYFTARDNRERASDNFLKLMREETHALRWLEKITVNLLREQFLPASVGQSSKEPIEQNKLSPQQLNLLYKTIIAASKVLKLLPQANETFILEKLHLSLDTIINGN